MADDPTPEEAESPATAPPETVTPAAAATPAATPPEVAAAATPAATATAATTTPLAPSAAATATPASGDAADSPPSVATAEPGAETNPRRVLESDEVDALLRGLDDAEEVTVMGGGGVHIRPYDLAHPEACGLRPMPVLDLIAERAVPGINDHLSRRLSFQVRGRSLPIQVREFGRFIHAPEPPAAISCITMNPGAAPCCLLMESRTVYRMIDLLFGGKPSETVKLNRRDFTRIEIRTASALAREILGAIGDAWKETAPVTFTWQSMETHPQFAAIMPPAETCMIMHWEVDLGVGDGDEITLCVPYPALDPIGALHDEVHSEEGDELRTLFRRRLTTATRELPVTFTARLANLRVPMRTVRALKVGDVLPLNRRPTEPVVALLEGIPKYLGVSGTYHGSRAVQILKPLKREAYHG